MRWWERNIMMIRKERLERTLYGYWTDKEGNIRLLSEAGVECEDIMGRDHSYAQGRDGKGVTGWQNSVVNIEVVIRRDRIETIKRVQVSIKAEKETCQCE